MAMEIKRISEWLDKDDTKHSLDEEKNTIYFGAQGAVQTAHFIRLKEDNEFFEYQIQLLKDDEFLKIEKDHKYILPLLQYLLRQNYIKKFGCWEYDYTDGDVRFSIEIPLESDGQITENQFKRICSLAFLNTDSMMKNILDILETGVIPNDDEDDSIKEFMRKLESLKEASFQKKEDEEDGI